jgi:hypothetical protein
MLRRVVLPGQRHFSIPSRYSFGLARNAPVAVDLDELSDLDAKAIVLISDPRISEADDVFRQFNTR